jgi:hypothetical protein
LYGGIASRGDHVSIVIGRDVRHKAYVGGTRGREVLRRERRPQRAMDRIRRGPLRPLRKEKRLARNQCVPLVEGARRIRPHLC